MSTGATQKAKVDSLMGVLMKRQQTFSELLPPDMGERRGEWFLAEVKVAAARAPKLADCTTISIVDALTTCAQLGLSPSGRLGSAYLVPYADKCTLIIGYRGYVDLAFRSGEVEAFHAEVVRAKDEFEHEEGLNPVLRHKPSEEVDGGELRAVYAMAKIRGVWSYVVMYRRQVLPIKQKSLSKKRAGAPPTPWETDEEEMWKKTAIRRLVKLLPLSPTKAKWLHKAEEHERAQEEAIDAEFSLSDEPHQSGVERAKAAVKALEAKTASTQAAEVAMGGEPSEAEKAAILQAEMEAAAQG